MKIQIESFKKDHASALLSMAIIALVVLSSLAGYLYLVSNENVMVNRSDTWNKSFQMAEAGVEEAMSMINASNSIFGAIPKWTNAVSGGWAITTNSTSLTWKFDDQTQTWKGIGTNKVATNAVMYQLTRYLDTTGNNYYTVYVYNLLNQTNTGPQILSIGSSVSYNPAAKTNITASRKIYMQTTLNSLNGNLSARTTIVLNGNNITADSFDSADSNHSTWQSVWQYGGTNYGFYPTNPSAKTYVTAPDYSTENYFRKDNAYICSDGTISAGNANICGYVDTGPGQAQPNLGPQGVAGGNNDWIGNPVTQTCDPASPYNHGIQQNPLHWLSDMNFAFIDVSLPQTNSSTGVWIDVPKKTGANAWTYTNYAGGTVTYNYWITNGAWGGKTNYQLTTKLTTDILVRGTNLILYLAATPDSLDFHGSSTTIFIDTNSDVTIYTAGNMNMSGNNNGINNITKYARSLRIYGLPSCTAITMGGQSTTTAYIYAPEATLDFHGAGGSYYGAVGAFYCNIVTMTGNYNFHYDEALNLINPPTGYLPKTWQEVQ